MQCSKSVPVGARVMKMQITEQLALRSAHPIESQRKAVTTAPCISSSNSTIPSGIQLHRATVRQLPLRTCASTHFRVGIFS